MKVSCANELVITKRTSRVIAIPQIWEHARIRKSIRTWSQKNRQNKVSQGRLQLQRLMIRDLFIKWKRICAATNQPFPFCRKALILAPTEALVAFCGL